MKYGYIKTCAATTDIRVADVDFNKENIIDTIERASKLGVNLLVFPELSITGYTAGDLFYTDVLLNAAVSALIDIKNRTASVDALIFLGLPIKKNNLIYNCAAAVYRGEILGVVPKSFLPNYNEFYEKRVFSEYKGENTTVNICGYGVPFGTKLIFECKNMRDFSVSCEICEDLWVGIPPSSHHAAAGANIIVNLSASNEIIGKADYRRLLIKAQSARLVAGYVYADAGNGESTTDAVFSGHNLIAENGKILNESELFTSGLTISEIDVMSLSAERSVVANYEKSNSGYDYIQFDMPCKDTYLTRVYSKTPFIPIGNSNIDERAELILRMQAEGLKTRLIHTRAKAAIVGVSGGLDSTLALIAANRAKELLPEDIKEEFKVIGITMPCFGTTKRTLSNAKKLCNSVGAELKEINIGKAVKIHLKDIGHSGNADVTFENAQARERTKVLMDYANMTGGLVVGTGDLSELALGFATFNGDHMSMYGVNSSIPKTLIKHLINHEAKAVPALRSVLADIIDTPISPELLPPENGKIIQITEERIGPYVLHDFFLYYFLRYRFSPAKILYIAERTFDGEYEYEVIKKWLKVFVKRFFSQQFKRNCLPDGVKVGTVSISPRADFRMPSDAVSELWLNDIEKL